MTGAAESADPPTKDSDPDGSSEPTADTESDAPEPTAADGPEPGDAEPVDDVDAPSVEERAATHDSHTTRETLDQTAAAVPPAEHPEVVAEPTESVAPDPPGPSAEPVTGVGTERKEVAVLDVSVEREPRPSTQEPAGEEPGETATLSAAGAAPATQTAAAKMSILDLLLAGFWGMMASMVQSAAGAPTLPAGSTVSLRSSSLQLTDTLSVPADWYFPKATESGEAPQHVIFLAHGFFTVGAMYSYTAARLAQDTGSIVVVPTMSWNPYAPQGLWLSGPAMQPVIANLFEGDRTALNASALAAGYAQLYGLDPALAELPRQFVLSGHSAGAALVLGAITHLDDGTLDDLTGVLMFDAVTSGSTAADALARLAAYEEVTGRYVPVHEISAPPNDWNRPSNIHQALATARPDHFNGVVIAGGAHTDSVRSGSSTVQGFISWLVGASPERSVLALQQVADDSLNRWYSGHSDLGYAATGGPTIVIPTPAGPNSATVLGVLPPVVVPTRADGDAIAV